MKRALLRAAFNFWVLGFTCGVAVSILVMG